MGCGPNAEYRSMVYVYNNTYVFGEQAGIRYDSGGATGATSSQLSVYGGTIEGGYWGIYVSTTTYAGVFLRGGTICGGSFGVRTSHAYNYVYFGYSSSELGEFYPVVLGGEYGAYLTSTSHVYFYDGLVGGETSAFNRVPTIIRDGCSLASSAKEIAGATYYTAYLEESE